jgi:hypothetical protein
MAQGNKIDVVVLSAVERGAHVVLVPPWAAPRSNLTLYYGQVAEKIRYVTWSWYLAWGIDTWGDLSFFSRFSLRWPLQCHLFIWYATTNITELLFSFSVLSFLIIIDHGGIQTDKYKSQVNIIPNWAFFNLFSPFLDFLLKCYLFLCNEALLLLNAKLVDVKDLIFPFGVDGVLQNCSRILLE